MSTGVFRRSPPTRYYTVSNAKFSILTTLTINNYLIAADSVNFSLGFQDVNLRAGQSISCDTSSFSLTAQQNSLITSRYLQADTSNITLNPQQNSLVTSRSILADQFSLNLTTQETLLKISRSIISDTCSYTINSQSSNLLTARVLSADQTQYDFSGVSTGFNYVFSADQGSITAYFPDAQLYSGKSISAEYAQYNLSGYSAFIARNGNYSLNGYDAILTKNFYIAADQASLNVNSQNFYVNLTMYGQTAQYQVSSQDTGIISQRIISSEQSNFNLTGLISELRKGKRLLADSDSISLNVQDADFSRTKKLLTIVTPISLSFPFTGLATSIIAQRRVFLLSAVEVDLFKNSRVLSDIGVISLSSTIGLLRHSRINPATYNLQVTGNNQHLNHSKRLYADFSNISITAYDALVYRNPKILAETINLSVQSQQTGIVAQRKILADLLAILNDPVQVNLYKKTILGVIKSDYSLSYISAQLTRQKILFSIVKNLLVTTSFVTNISRRLYAEYASLSTTFNNADFSIQRNINPLRANITLISDINAYASRLLGAQCSTFILSSSAVSLPINMRAETIHLKLSTSSAQFRLKITCVTQNYSLSGQNITIKSYRLLSCDDQSLSSSANQIGLNLTRQISAEQGSLTVNGQQSNKSRTMVAETSTLNLTAIPADMLYSDPKLSIDSVSLSLSGQVNFYKGVSFNRYSKGISRTRGAPGTTYRTRGRTRIVA